MTHNERVLALLQDGEPHSHHEIYGLYVIGHSRIADLRKRGHVIESWREGDDYMYRLCPEVTAAAIPSPLAVEGSLHRSDLPSGQLSLVDV